MHVPSNYGHCLPEGSLWIEVSEIHLHLPGCVVQHRHGDKHVEKVFRIVKEVRESVTLCDQHRVRHPLFAHSGCACTKKKKSVRCR